MAELASVIAALRSMDNDRITGEVRRELAATMRPFAPRVRAAILNTPAYGDKHTGLRARIAACVQTWAEVHGTIVSVGVEVNAARMPDGQKSLPLMLEGSKPWRHPLFGDTSRWVGQQSHPYFWGAVGAAGPATQRAVERAVENLARQLDALAG